LAEAVQSSNVSPQTTTAEERVIPWERLVDKKVKTFDGEEGLSKVKSISPDFIDVEEGLGKKNRYLSQNTT
jgi:hypothetical protein